MERVQQVRNPRYFRMFDVDAGSLRYHATSQRTMRLRQGEEYTNENCGRAMVRHGLPDSLHIRFEPPVIPIRTGDDFSIFRALGIGGALLLQRAGAIDESMQNLNLRKLQILLSDTFDKDKLIQLPLFDPNKDPKGVETWLKGCDDPVRSDPFSTVSGRFLRGLTKRDIEKAVAKEGKGSVADFPFAFPLRSGESHDFHQMMQAVVGRVVDFESGEAKPLLEGR